MSSQSSKKRKHSDITVKYYSVKAGHTPGVYTVWDDCLAQVTGFQGAQFKSFETRAEAELYTAGKLTSGSKPKATGDRFYAVAVGRVPGVYETWDEAQAQVTGVKGPKYKKFPTRVEAESFISQHKRASSTSTSKGASGPKATPGSSTSMARQTVKEITESVDVITPATKKVKTKIGSSSGKAGLKGNKLTVYTDGSSRGNGRPGAVAGVGVYFGQGDPRNVSESLKGTPQTNQRAELTAILRALQIASQDSPIHIITDSNYSINCCTTWWVSWQKNGWKTSTGSDVMNKDLIVAIRELIDLRTAHGVKTEFEWVKGHSNNEGNVAADRLAVNGAMLGMR